MIPIKICDGVYLLKANHWDRQVFDELIPLPEGTTYNSYLVVGGEKNAIIDAVDFSKELELVECIKNLNLNIDYIVCNHAEQDHSGAIPRLLELYPDSKIVANERCKKFLKELLLIPEERFLVIEDGQELYLGSKTLKFVFMPWVHWPETMVTFLVEDRILFSCDLFGSHYASSNIYVTDERKEYLAAKRYYAEIMMPFRKLISKYIEEVRKMNPKIIAPSHGSLYKDTEFILKAYEQWTSDKTENTVIIVFVSMHGSIRKIVDYIVDKLTEKNINVKYYNATLCDIGEFAMDLVDASTLILATPTVLGGPHPKIVDISYLVNLLRPKLKYVAYITSYNWSTKAIEYLKSILKNLSVEVLYEIEIEGYPKEKDFTILNNLVNKIYEKHQEQIQKEVK